MDETQIRELVRRLDTRDGSQEEAAWALLRPLGAGVVPYLAEFYPNAKKLEGRRAIVFHATRHARTTEAAFQLGVAALNDRASIVRYRACCILAYSLRRDAIPYLEKMLEHKDSKTAADALAAIDAIKSQNHHYFIDRDHSGRQFWSVNDDDSPIGQTGDELRSDGTISPQKKRPWWRFWS
ncbi:MAG: hypothetical protein HY290_17925 [Planctomycetia bacterium]|nr:hypothetical protein [Planctomycetia bacterium]